MKRFAWWLVVASLLAGCGATPTPAPPPLVETSSPITVGDFADERHGWMMADGSAERGLAFTDDGALSTTDGGRTWERLAPERVGRGTRFLDERFGWDLEQGLRLTYDAGMTWVSRPTPCAPDSHANAASFVDQRTGFLLCLFFQGSGGSSKWLYGTADGGEHWELLTGTLYGQAPPGFPPGVLVRPGEAPPAGALPAAAGSGKMLFVDAVHGFIAFANSGPNVGHSYKTADGGRTWTRLTIPRGPFTGGFRFFSPAFGRMLVNDRQEWAWVETRDGGVSWEQIYPPVE